jgi:hypothetical protein
MPLRKVQFIIKNFTDESTKDNPILLEKIPWAVGIANLTRHDICALSCEFGWSFIPAFECSLVTYEGNETIFKHLMGDRIFLRIQESYETGLSKEEVIVDIYYKE